MKYVVIFHCFIFELDDNDGVVSITMEVVVLCWLRV